MINLLLVTGPEPVELVAFAANELKRYVSALFGISAVVSPDLKPAEKVVFLAAASAGLDRPSDEQAFLLRRFIHAGRPAFAAVGGSPAATLWAVYELVERWGVHYLLHGDVFPSDAGEFHFPDLDQTFTPNLRSRCWRLINAFVCGPESWSLEENRRFLDQLAKLKFNEIFLSFWPWQSYVHYEFRGVAKRTGVSAFGFRYPIDDGMVGRELFGDAKEFENPDLAGLREDYGARHEAARRQAQGILDHARARGMRTGLAIQILEYPLEFMKALPGAEVADQLGSLTCRPSADQKPDDSLLQELVRTVIRAHVRTYPHFDCLYLSMPEHRSWMGRVDNAWIHLDAKYGISRIMSLENAIAKAKSRTHVVGGVERQVERVKSDLVALWMLDEVLADGKALERADGRAPRLVYGNLAEELYPLLPKLFPAGGSLMNFTDYTARRVVDQIETLDNAPSQKIPCRQIFTLEDDNIGLLPQIATKPLGELATRIRARGWEGFTTRYWTIGCHDITAHYLARCSWDASVTPEKSCSEFVAGLCGEVCEPPLKQAWELIEANTDTFDQHGIGFAFTTPEMMKKHWEDRKPMAEVFRSARQRYEQAWTLVGKAAAQTKPTGKPFVSYLLGRLRYGVCYMDAVEAACAAGVAEKEGRRREAVIEMEKALAAIREAIQAYASVAADNSDRGAVAALNEYCCRPICGKLAELRKTGNP